MGKEIRYIHPSTGELREKETRQLLQLRHESDVADFIDTRKPDEIREAMPLDRPGVVNGAMKEFWDRIRAGRLVVAKKQIGNSWLPIGFATSLPRPERPLHEVVRSGINANPILRRMVKTTPIIGPMITQKPAVDLERLYIDPEFQDNKDLIENLGRKALDKYDFSQRQVSYVPYQKVEIDSPGGPKEIHLPEGRLQPTAMQLLDFEVIPTAKPFEDPITLGAEHPLLMQPYEHKTLASRS